MSADEENRRYHACLERLRSTGDDPAAASLVVLDEARAIADLVQVIETTQRPGTSRACAFALATTRTPAGPRAIDALLHAGKLRALPAAQALRDTRISTETLLSALRSPSEQAYRWAALWLVGGLRQAGHAELAHDPLTRRDRRRVADLERLAASPALRDALERVIERGEPAVWDADARVLCAWLRATAR